MTTKQKTSTAKLTPAEWLYVRSALLNYAQLWLEAEELDHKTKILMYDTVTRLYDKVAHQTIID